MQPASRPLAGALVLLPAATGCERGAGPDAAPRLPDVPERVERIADQSVYYRCEGGFEVVVAGDTAQVALPDGRGVRLARDVGGHAMEFAGEALAFSVAGGVVVLTRDEGGRFACTGRD